MQTAQMLRGDGVRRSCATVPLCANSGADSTSGTTRRRQQCASGGALAKEEEDRRDMGGMRSRVRGADEGGGRGGEGAGRVG